VLILLNPTIPTYGVLANLLAEPAAPIATVLGLLACTLLRFVPGLGLIVSHVAWLPSAWIAAVAEFFAGLPAASIPWAPGPIGVAAAALVVVLVLGSIPFGAGSRERRLRRASRIGLGLVLAGYLGIAGGDAARQQLSRPGDWQIAMCDIGQGDAVLVRSEGRVALIDAGPDVALLRRCLDTLGIGRLDLVVLTHYDIDHVGGAAAVFGQVDSVLVGPPDGSPASQLAETFARNGADVAEVSQGVNGRLGELKWEVLWPRSPLRGVLPGNDASVTLRFTGAGDCAASGCLSSIFLGDLGREPQALLMAANSLGGTDVVKVAHHGSSDQNPRLYANLDATIGLIGVGAENRYGHPTDSLLSVLAEQGTLAVRTDIQGMALLSPRPDGTVSVWTEHPLR
jgi:competence protein ComEC